MIELHSVQQGTTEWLKLRDDLYTGSNADKILTSSDKTIIIDSFKKKYAANRESKFSGNYDTRRGHKLEPEAVEIYERITGNKIRRDIGFITNSRYKGCGYSPDGWQVEVKCFAKEKHLSIDSKSKIPFKVLAQVHFGMLISGWKWIDLIFYNPEVEPIDAIRIFRIRRDQNIINNFKRKIL